MLRKDKLLLLAEWFDKCYTGPSDSDEVQQFLRGLSTELDSLERGLNLIRSGELWHVQDDCWCFKRKDGKTDWADGFLKAVQRCLDEKA